MPSFPIAAILGIGLIATTSHAEPNTSDAGNATCAQSLPVTQPGCATVKHVQSRRLQSQRDALMWMVTVEGKSGQHAVFVYEEDPQIKAGEVVRVKSKGIVWTPAGAAARSVELPRSGPLPTF